MIIDTDNQQNKYCITHRNMNPFIWVCVGKLCLSFDSIECSLIASIIR